MARLGILGGMGPAATAHLFTRVVELTNASCDQEHVEITLLNRPGVPDRTAYLLRKQGALNFIPVLQEMALELEAAGCFILAMPCNTAHTCLPEISSVLTSARFVDMLNETVALTASLGCSRVGILATDGTLSTKAYQHAFTQAGLEVVVPEGNLQRTVMSIIYENVKAGIPVPEEKVESVMSALACQGCDGVILGCTELSVIGIPAYFLGMPVIDALDVLAWRCVQECGATPRSLAVLRSQDAFFA